MKLKFKSKDGLKLTGILDNPKNKTEKCVILCHGITVDKDEEGAFLGLADRLIKAGFAVFRFDFRGHGESQGKSTDLTVKGETEDLKSALRFLASKGYKRFGIVAASFAGGPTAFLAPKNRKIRSIVFWNSALEYKSLLKRWLANGGKEQLENKGFFLHHDFKIGRRLINEISGLEPWKELRKTDVPIIFIHGTDDMSVPYKNSMKFAKMTHSRVETIYGSKHGFHTKKHSKLASTAAVNFFSETLANNFTGVIIEESLENKSVLKELKITGKKIEKATKGHKTPWVRRWTLDKVEIPESEARGIAVKLSKALDQAHRHSWYADFKNDTHHYIIFRNKVFFIDRSSKKQYDAAAAYGLAMGIPGYQLDFSPHIKEWKR